MTKARGILNKGPITVHYTTRPLPGGKFGIHVKTYRNGLLETEDLNTTPWPSVDVALDRALRAARAELERETT